MFRKNLAAKLTLVPSAVVVAVCFYGTILWTLYISLTHSTMLPNYEFYGFGQYATLLSMPRWHTAFANMLIFGSLFIAGSPSIAWACRHKNGSTTLLQADGTSQ